MMRSLRLLVLILVFTCPVFAQQPDMYMGSAQRPIRITTGVVYQEYADGEGRISQVAFPFRAFIPLVDGLGFAVMTSPVLVEAEGLESVNGMSDTQVAVSYFRNVGPGSLVLSLTSNLPSGKRELTPDEFSTIALLGQDIYGFGVPVLGQGLNLAPGVTFAYPLNNNVVVGVGAAYQLKGEFSPVASASSEDFKPGDELILTGGVDVRVGRAWAVSGNFSYATYQEDTLGDVSIFESGDQAIVGLQLLGNLGTNQLRINTRYRSKAKSVLPEQVDVTGTGNIDVVSAPRTIPQQFLVGASYRMFIQESIQATIIGRMRYYEATTDFTDKTRFDVGAIQEYSFTESLGAALRFIYTFGSFPGVEVGGGLVVTI